MSRAIEAEGRSQAEGRGSLDLVRRIGVGGMAETFLALRRGPQHFEQRVCDKRMHSHLEADKDARALFLREAKITARLRHPNIVQVIDLVEEGPNLHLVLELIEGVDAKALIIDARDRKEWLSQDMVLFIVSSVAKALENAHAEGVMHRDISASNVLLSTSGEVKLADFGIARAFDMTRMSKAGTVKGKIGYMAPEYARSGEYTPRADMFSFGVLLYELVALRKPHTSARHVEVIAKALRGERKPLIEVCRCDPALSDLAERCLAAKPKDRPSGFDEICQVLDRLAQSPLARRELSKIVRKLHQPAKLALPGEPEKGAGETREMEGGQAVDARNVRPASAEDPTKTSARVAEIEGATTQLAQGAGAHRVAEPSETMDVIIPRPPRPKWLWIAVPLLAILVLIGIVWSVS